MAQIDAPDASSGPADAVSGSASRIARMSTMAEMAFAAVISMISTMLPGRRVVRHPLARS